MERSTLSDLQQLAEEMEVSEEEVIAEAVRSGIQQLRRERALAAYVRGELSRDQAIDRVGVDWVEMADRQREAVEAEVAWALK
jgi:hypothetical protein